MSQHPTKKYADYVSPKSKKSTLPIPNYQIPTTNPQSPIPNPQSPIPHSLIR
ncbi:MAG: hypothetical protein AAF630_12430 [Cyanobacteria bacterium P01_C01_bin.38]